MESIGSMNIGKDNYSMFMKPAVLETFADLMASSVPIWAAVALGLVVGWSWKPRWVSFFVLGFRGRSRLAWSTPPGFGARRLWLAMTAITAYPVLKEVWSKFRSWMWPGTLPQGLSTEEMSSAFSGNELPVTNQDLTDLVRRLDGKDGGASWNILMEKSTDGMFYQAWRREPMNGDGPTEYKSRTVLEGVSPELANDFFWDDEFRSEWDDMLIFSRTLEECPRTGAMIVQWVRKYPFFCKDREYIIGRRIWRVGNDFYCITKGVPYPKTPPKNSPRRVENCYSSWRIRAVESHKGDGQLSACEVMLFHHEDMGIQRDLAKLGVRQGMWGCVKKIEPGIQKYHMSRKEKHPVSKSALMARIYTKVPSNFLRELGLLDTPEAEESDDMIMKPRRGNLRWFILGGAIALACGVDGGAVGKVLVFGIARKLGKFTRRL